MLSKLIGKYHKDLPDYFLGDLIKILEQDNPAFDPYRFEDAVIKESIKNA